MEKGKKINPHLHSVNSDCYLGGHVCVQVNNTSTYYINPINQINDPEIYQSKNQVGKITLFQNNIPHFTDEHKNDKERITIAFDLSLVKHSENYIKII
jgi:ATP-dependent phosphoenolpyruvate carboxykinase